MVYSWCFSLELMVAMSYSLPLRHLLLRPPQRPVHHRHLSLNPSLNRNRRPHLPLRCAVSRYI